MYEFDKYYIPERMMGGIERYIKNGIEPGSFLSAVIRNDLTYAVMCADDENRDNLPAYVSYFYNEAPQNCWGNSELMDAWIESHLKVRECEQCH